MGVILGDMGSGPLTFGGGEPTFHFLTPPSPSFPSKTRGVTWSENWGPKFSTVLGSGSYVIISVHDIVMSAFTPDHRVIYTCMTSFVVLFHI